MESLKAQCNLHENPKKNNPGRKRNNRDEKVAKELTEHERTEKTLLACMLAGRMRFMEFSAILFIVSSIYLTAAHTRSVPICLGRHILYPANRM